MIYLQLLSNSTKHSVNLDISFNPEETAATATLKAVNQTAEKADKMVTDVTNQVRILVQILSLFLIA